MISSQLRIELNLRLIHYFGSGGQSAPIRRTVRGYTTWPTTVNLGHIDLPCHVTHPRTVRATLADGPLVHPRSVSWAQSPGAMSHPRPHSSARPSNTWESSPSLLSHSLSLLLPQALLSLAKPWRSSPSSTLTIEAPPRRSTTGGRRRTTPTSCTTPISSSSLGRSFPQRVLLLLHLLLQAPSKEDDPELLQASPDDLKPLPVSYSTPVSVSPPRSIPHCPRIEAKDSPRAQSPLLT